MKHKPSNKQSFIVGTAFGLLFASFALVVVINADVMQANKVLFGYMLAGCALLVLGVMPD